MKGKVRNAIIIAAGVLILTVMLTVVYITITTK